MAYALRRLIKDPGFTLIAVATLTLGIGVNTADLFGRQRRLAESAPVSSARSARRALLADSRWAAGFLFVSQLPRLGAQQPLFSDLAAFRPDDLNLIGLGQPERVPAEMVSASFFRLLAVQPLLGRPFR